MSLRRIFILSAFLCGVLALSGCGLISGTFSEFASVVGLSETGTVIAKRAQIRTSYAVVAQDLLEVKRGEELDILDQVEFERVLWYRVRAHDEDQTEGWIEAQNLIINDLLEKSRALAEEDKNTPAQATGMLRAKSNLRLSPELREDNLLLKLENGASFEITSWKFVPKAQDVADVDDSNKGERKQSGGRTKSSDLQAPKEVNEPERLDEKYDVWYKVRLDPSISPAPAGWLFGRQVELQIPTDIIFYQDNKKFVGWQKIDGVSTSLREDPKIATPSSWVVLYRTNTVKAIDGEEPHFDGVLVFGYDKYDQTHYRVYPLINDVWGMLPLEIEGTGDSRTFTLRLRNKNTGAIEPKRFVVSKENNRYRLKVPDDMASYQSKDGK